MKIYTKTGDRGTTGLASGRRIPKDDTRIELIGLIDELNASLGVARAFSKTWVDPISKMARINYNSMVLTIQNDLFYIGAILAQAQMEGFDLATRIRYWEQVIDGLDAQLPPLTHFILPGGSRVASLLHLSRAVCRRVERFAVHFHKEHKQDVGLDIVVYFNRLSDVLFTLARWVNNVRRAREIKWPIER